MTWVPVALLAVLALFAAVHWVTTAPARRVLRVGTALAVALVVAGIALAVVTGRAHFLALAALAGMRWGGYFMRLLWIRRLWRQWRTGGAVGGGGNGTQTGTSRVRSAFLELVLDHDTQALDGRVLAGELAGQTLSALTDGQLASLQTELDAQDPKGADMLRRYVERRFASRGSGEESAEFPQTDRAKPMDEAEARSVMGWGAGEALWADKINARYRSLIRQAHPDLGGTAYLATKINEARKVLLSRFGDNGAESGFEGGSTG